MKVVLDASVVIAYLERADALHERALAVLERLAVSDFVLHPLTYAEILVGPARAGSADAVSAALDALEVEIAPFGRDEAQQLAQTRAASGLKTPDACVLATAVALRSPLASFDERLARAAERHDVVAITH